MTPPHLPVRPIAPDDPAVAALAAIEEAAGPMFAEVMDISHWSPAPSGEQRLQRPGFVLVAGDPPVGFAHVLDLGGHAHLDQLSVHPDHMRRGTGRGLVTTAQAEAARRGHPSMTLSTFADIPWNAPFYRQLGFREIDERDAPEPVRELRERERSAGLDGGGRRVIMSVHLATSTVEPRPAVSVIPLRDGPDGVEVFVQHRQSTMDFAAGAVVFPGGRCDPGDVAAGAGIPLRPEVEAEHVRRWGRWSPTPSDPLEHARTLLATGLRELEEETGLVAPPSALHPWDRWITPAIVPKRFDVAFYVLPVPHEAPGQPQHRTSEATRSGWEPAGRLLADLSAGRLTMLTPTRVILEEIVALGAVATVVGHRPVITGVRDDRPDGRPRASDPSGP
ncbi:GNAT family N-acetyltransferase [Janibacter sp. DB-40]|uniref:GNAT family N-acetyltransferase n=1 Tax=Janibacter sp. DB-40 TaxID=3028808 RepID=UPI0024060A9F|nr:GNAT family N-acetyltransferase [Janibacter sp. DB-40]